MSDRYTSHELSKKLAEAGLDQNVADGACWTEKGLVLPCNWSIPEAVRALDLTDVLTELERPRPTDGIPFAPLIGIIKIDRLPGVPRADWCVQTPFSKGISDRVVEAAGICLLGFLDELKAWEAQRG